MFEIFASFLFGVLVALLGVLIFWITSGRSRHQTLAEQRYKVILEILSEILEAQRTGDVKKLGAAIRSSAWLIGAPVVDLLLRFIDRPPKPRTQEMTDLMCEIVTAARKDLGLLPIEKDKIAKLLTFEPKF